MPRLAVYGPRLRDGGSREPQAEGAFRPQDLWARLEGRVPAHGMLRRANRDWKTARIPKISFLIIIESTQPRNRSKKTRLCDSGEISKSCSVLFSDSAFISGSRRR